MRVNINARAFSFQHLMTDAFSTSFTFQIAFTPQNWSSILFERLWTSGILIYLYHISCCIWTDLPSRCRQGVCITIHHRQHSHSKRWSCAIFVRWHSVWNDSHEVKSPRATIYQSFALDRKSHRSRNRILYEKQTKGYIFLTSALFLIISRAYPFFCNKAQEWQNQHATNQFLVVMIWRSKVTIYLLYTLLYKSVSKCIYLEEERHTLKGYAASAVGFSESRRRL